MISAARRLRAGGLALPAVWSASLREGAAIDSFPFDELPRRGFRHELLVATQHVSVPPVAHFICQRELVDGSRGPAAQSKSPVHAFRADGKARRSHARKLAVRKSGSEDSRLRLMPVLSVRGPRSSPRPPRAVAVLRVRCSWCFKYCHHVHRGANDSTFLPRLARRPACGQPGISPLELLKGTRDWLLTKTLRSPRPIRFHHRGIR